MINKIKIKRLNVSEFRNYVSLRLVFDSQQTIFVGDNGAGKTNILEAISLLSPGRGLRRASYSDVTRIGSIFIFVFYFFMRRRNGWIGGNIHKIRIKR